MTSNLDNKNVYIVPKAPRPKVKIIPKIPSYIKLIEVDDDSDSESEKEKQQPNLYNCKKQLNKDKDDQYLSDDRYEDSFDEEFGECETNPDSGKIKINEEN